MSRSFRRSASAVFALAALVPALAACGGGGGTASPEAAATASASFPLTVHGLTFDKAPSHIVSLSATATEILFAVGAGDQVAAVDQYSTYPAEAPEPKFTSDSGPEDVAAAQPDLVVVANDSDLVTGLKQLDIPVLIEAAAVTLEDSYAQIRELGDVTGHAKKADQVATDMEAGVAAVVKGVGSDPKPLTYYYELDPTYYSVTSKTFMGNALSQLGLVNIADAAAGNAGDYPQLSAELVVNAAPDLIVLADTKCCKQSAATVKARAGWSTIPAVASGNVVELDDDIASRWGPRVVDLMTQVASAAEAARAG